MVAFATPNFPPVTEVYAVDFESTYTTGRDIKSLGTGPYVRHPETKIYLVSIYGPGVAYSGSLEEAPWHLIDGKHWVSHNASFDAVVYLEAIRRGQIPEGIAPCEWDCTANLAVFCGSGRSLAAAVEAFFGVRISKAVRDEMKGKTWETMTPEFRAQAIAYAMTDAKWCWELWDGLSHNWPAQEVAVSRHTLMMCMRGVAIDVDFIHRPTTGAKALLRAAQWDAEGRIPWANELDVKGKPITIGSRKALHDACAKVGIPPPLSTADKNDLFDRWLAEYADRAPFVKAVKEHRSVSRTLDVVRKFDGRIIDGRMPYDLKYGGAHTLRWSGGSGLNLQNLTKKQVAGVDLRGCICPGPGKKFIVADLKQIEARVALWFAEDWKQLALLKDGMDVYEAHARATMGYAEAEALKDYVLRNGLSEVEKNLRQIAKARVLGLGFGMGHARLIDFAKTTLKLNLDVATAKRIVDGFRRDNRGIVKMWNMLHSAMERHAISPDRKEPFSIELPSWRSLEYYDVNLAEGLQAKDERGGHSTHWFGGKLFENLVQATARDILVEAILRIEAAGYPVVLHIHDEVVCEVDMDVPPGVIEALMSVTPDWAPDLPVGSTVKEAARYFKD